MADGCSFLTSLLSLREEELSPEAFVYGSVELQDRALRPHYFRSLLRGALGAALQRYADDDKEYLLREVEGCCDASAPPTPASAAAALLRWRHRRLRRWRRFGDCDRAALLACRLFLRAPPSKFLYDLARRKLEAEPVGAPSDELEPLRSEREAPPAPRKLLELQRRLLLRAFRAELFGRCPALDVRVAGAACRALQEALERAEDEAQAEGLVRQLLALAATMPADGRSLVADTLDEWRSICGKAMAKWRPHEQKDTRVDAAALRHLVDGVPLQSPEDARSPVLGPAEAFGGQEAEGPVPEARLGAPELAGLSEERAARLLAGYEASGPSEDYWRGFERWRSGEDVYEALREDLLRRLGGDEELWDLVERRVADLQRHRRALLHCRETSSEGRRDAAGVLAQMDEEVRRHAAGLPAEVYFRLATTSTLGLLSRLACYLEQQLASEPADLAETDDVAAFWRSFADWLRLPPQEPWHLPPFVECARLTHACRACGRPAVFRAQQLRSADEAAVFSMICSDPRCGFETRL